MARTEDEGNGRAVAAVAVADAMDSPRQVAEALRLWATENHLLRGGTSPMSVEQSVQEAAAMPADAVGIFERQAITAFGVNERRGRVYVYTNKRVTNYNPRSYLLPQMIQSKLYIAKAIADYWKRGRRPFNRDVAILHK